MSRDKCVIDATAALRKLKGDDGQKEIEALSKLVEDTIENANVSGKDIRLAVQELSKEIHKNIEMHKLQKVESMLKFEEMSEFLNQEGFKGDKKAAFFALIATDNKKKYKGKGNLERRKNTVKNDGIAMVMQTLSKHDGLEARWYSGEIDADVTRVLLAKKGDDLSKIGPEIKDLAKTIRKLNNHTLQLKQQIKFGTRKLDDFIAPQQWKFEDMLKLGDTPEAAEVAWKSLAKKTMDFDRMNIRGAKDQDAYLNRFWEKRSDRRNTRRVKVSDDFEEVSASAVSEKMGKTRSVHFKNAEAVIEYNEAIGAKTLAERIYAGIDKDAGKIAEGQMFGPNGKAVVTKLLNDAANDLTDADIKKIKSVIDFAVNGAQHDEMNIGAMFADKAAKLTDMAKLGTALPTTLTDIAFLAGVLNKQNGKGYLHNQFRVMKEFQRQFKDIKIQKQVAGKIGVFAEDFNSLTMTNRFGDNEMGTVTGKFDKFTEAFMKATGLPRQSRAMRGAGAKLISTDLFENINTNFDELMPAMQEVLEKFGINNGNWKHLKGAVEDFGDGTQGITSSALHDLPDAAFGGLSKSEIVKMKQELSSGLTGYFTDLSELGSPTPGILQRYWKEHIDRNSAMGIAAKMIGKYKSFALAQFKTMNHIVKAGAPPGKFGDIGNTSKTILAATGWGYLALLSKDILKGKPLHDPTDLKTIGESFVQSGAGLLYTDFLSADYRKSYRSIAADFAGPVIGGIGNDFATLMSEVVRGDVTAAKTLSKIERNSPSLFFSKAMLNKNILEGANRAINGKPSRKTKGSGNFYSVFED